MANNIAPDPAERDIISSSQTSNLQIALICGIVLLACLLITWKVWDIEQKQETEEARIYFEGRVHEAVVATRQRLLAQEQVLRGVQGLLSSSFKINHQEFRRYVENLQLEENYPGILGVGFSQVVPPAKIKQQIAAIRKEYGRPDYVIKPEGKRDFYTSIIYLEPFTWRNQRAFGYDMFTEPTRRAAMQRAMDSGKPSMSGKSSCCRNRARMCKRVS